MMTEEARPATGHPLVRWRDLERQPHHKTSGPTNDLIWQVVSDLRAMRTGLPVYADTAVHAALRIAARDLPALLREVHRIEREKFVDTTVVRRVKRARGRAT